MLGLGAVLIQHYDEDYEYMVAYASHLNNEVESYYNLYEEEFLAVVWAISHFYFYLFGI